MNKMKTSLFCAVVLMVVANVGAETIFEKFDSDPTSGGGWTSSTPGDSTFTYNAALGGYLDAVYVRDATDVDRYTKALSATYDRAQEYWWEVDIQMDSTSYFGTKMGSTGVFNSANDNKTNVLIGEYGYGSSTKRIDAHLYKDDSSTRYKICADPTADDAILRIKCHYFVVASTNKGYIKMEVYDIPTGTLVGDTGNWNSIAVGEDIAYNVFGLANLYGSHQGDDRDLTVKIDNLYFSTDGANANPVDPGFIPEPATMVLLSLGGVGLLIRRRRRA